MIAAIVFIWICSAIIALFTLLGGGYYTVVPVQVGSALAMIMTYLIAQKDFKRREFVLFIVIGVFMAMITAHLMFVDLFSSVPGFKGVSFGIAVCIAFSMAYFVLITAVKNIFVKEIKTSERRR